MLPRPHRARPLAIVGALSVAVLVMSLASCGDPDDSADEATTSWPAPTPTTTSERSSTTVSTTTALPTSTTTTSTTTTSTTAAAVDSVSLPIPDGGFVTFPNDLFVLRRNGDFEIRSAGGGSTLVADYPDPFGPVNEGPGPNVVDEVAGVVGGSVVFGDCCEPISGNLLVATGPDDDDVIGPGYSPTLSPTGDLLGVANDYVVSQTAADATGAGSMRVLNQDPEAAYLNVRDLTWSSMATATGDDDHLVLLGWTDAGWSLHDVDRSTLEPTATTDLGIAPVADAPDTDAYFAGHGPDAEIVVAVNDDESTRLRHFDPISLTERPQLERSLAATATSVRLAGDGLGLLWVDGGSLYRLPAEAIEPEWLGDGYLAAWFIRSADVGAQ